MRFTTFAAAAAIATAALPTTASAYAAEHLASKAAISLAQARTTATQRVPGKIVSEELERESGGSGLRYTFDIEGATGVREVGVDAKTGRILEDGIDSEPPAKPSR